MRFLCRKCTWEGRRSPTKLHPPQPVPSLQQLLLFLSQSRDAPCIPVEMLLNPLDHTVLPTFAASH